MSNTTPRSCRTSNVRSVPHNVGALLSEEEDEEETTLPTCSAVEALQRTALKGEVVSMILYKKPPPFCHCEYVLIFVQTTLGPRP